ncbi:MAG: hypothetical protein ABI232_11380 [Jatrophihabitantaceae bacterium]
MLAQRVRLTQADASGKDQKAGCPVFSADVLRRALGLGRLAVGAAVLAAPDASVRALGVDTASAKRLRFLTRMAGARDLGLAAGTLAASGRGRRTWLLVGAGVDAADAIAITVALRDGQVRGLAARATVAIAASAVAAGIVGAISGWRRQ